jgi:hypothetical protein
LSHPRHWKIAFGGGNIPPEKEGIPGCSSFFIKIKHWFDLPLIFLSFSCKVLNVGGKLKRIFLKSFFAAQLFDVEDTRNEWIR